MASLLARSSTASSLVFYLPLIRVECFYSFTSLAYNTQRRRHTRIYTQTIPDAHVVLRLGMHQHTFNNLRCNVSSCIYSSISIWRTGRGSCLYTAFFRGWSFRYWGPSLVGIRCAQSGPAPSTWLHLVSLYNTIPFTCACDYVFFFLPHGPILCWLDSITISIHIRCYIPVVCIWLCTV